MREVETFEAESSGTHFDREFTAADYPTVPPTSGDHNPVPIEPGIYRSPPPLGESVHLLEHGGVIVWTNGLSTDDQKAVERAVRTEAEKGYYQLAVIENPDLEVPFGAQLLGLAAAVRNRRSRSDRLLRRGALRARQHRRASARLRRQRRTASGLRRALAASSPSPSDRECPNRPYL